ncbi:ABC transporter substrate-binding protein [Azospirillum picis]|uniref:Branched-chain amino acid transport system substrate-binding protein n=1 Tax=Azospirillum picis TaxID=488438 RepID=A0ABU0MME9_9PROT|nr:ABC transporter substrate-binding protein [Azospirillum picis]MBP2300676.1 branched-chain amino acid transport system substrate-binding protein [Azospirillum picis]MDQ0534645.1 branched-chain amino acid transport system substrate-binding protein [Azospirillum picis]
MEKLRSGRATCLILGLILGLGTLPAGAGRASAADEIVIGEIHPITGPATFYGLPESRGIQLAADRINKAGGVTLGGKSYQIRIATEDDQASPTTGVAALRKLVSADVRFIIGPLASGVAPALKPIIERNDKLTQLIDGTIADDMTNGKNIFRNQATASGYNVAVVKLFSARKYKSVAMMTDRFHAGFMNSQKTLAADLKGLGVTTASEDFYKLGDTDFSATLTNLRGRNVDVLLIRGYPAEGALITKQARQLGFSGQVVWEMVSPPSTVLKNIPAAEMEGVFNCIPLTTEDYVKLGDEKAKALDQAYRGRFNEGPGELTALSYDAVYIFKAAFEKAGSLDNAAVNKAMAALKVADIPELVTRYTPQPDGRLFASDGQVDLRGEVSVWRGEGWEPASLKD